MRFFAIILFAAVVSACATTYQEPTTIAKQKNSNVDASKEHILESAKQVFVSEGYQITNADIDIGIVSTSLRDIRLTPDQADCGTTMGIDSLKDKRTATRAGYNVIAEDGKINIFAIIEGEDMTGVVDQEKKLTCISRGTLEDEMLSKIITVAVK
jgi:hypothetical protein